MADERRMPRYYVLDSENPRGMLLYDLPDPELPDLSWSLGTSFHTPPVEPVVATIRTNNEDCLLLPYFNTPQLMSDEFYQALCEAGVDNLDVYDAVLRSEDGTVEYRGYKAFNVIGMVSAADRKKTVFRDPPGERLIDASIDHLEIDPDKPRGLLLFRLAEFTAAVVVHERVKEHLEKKGFHSVVFRECRDFVS